MRAIILAGGRGTRLDPLTRDLPKPLVPFFDRPLIEYQIRWLASCGFDEITISLGHLGDRIVSTLGYQLAGVPLSYVKEPHPLGTAGAVALALEHGIGSHPVVVVPGDALADYDLAAVYQEFLSRPEPVGMIVKQVADPRGFGVVTIDGSGRATGFQEKPSAVEQGQWVNTGIYFLKQPAIEWPDRRPLDFAYDLFPLWTERGHVAALKAPGYWSDLGTLAQYRRSHFDALDGLVAVAIPEPTPGAAIVDRTARVIEPVWLGDGVTIDAQATVGPYAVIGTGSYVGPWSKVERAVVGQSVFLGAGSRVSGATIAERVVIGGRCRVEHHAAIGANSRIGWGTRVAAGRHFAPASHVSPNTVDYVQKLVDVTL
ncbi:MAG: NDP-sugar synthase [Firmicutes bacterium]|nr:NDP-sugar synthase [Bacillota bacterium]